MTDQELLQEFIRYKSEDAFAHLVKRYLDLVYSAALRQLRSNHLAEEVVQKVFLELVRRATRLKPDAVLASWLYQVARRTSLDALREESRRRAREQISVELSAANTEENDWGQIEHLLDDAMQSLEEKDREAVLLRYFENKSLSEVGNAIGVSEEAARKRVSRATTRLRDFFSKKGVTIDEAGLAVSITSNAIQGAPLHLGIAVIKATPLALTAAKATSAKLSAQLIMNGMKAKGMVATVVLVIVTGIATREFEKRETDRLRTENTALVAQNNELIGRVGKVRSRPADQTGRSSVEKDELLRLRNEVGLLRQQEGLQKAKSTAPLQRDSGINENKDGSTPTSQPLSREYWKFQGYATPEKALESVAWSMSQGDVKQFLESLTPKSREHTSAQFQGKAPEDLFKMVMQFGREIGALRFDRQATLPGGDVKFTIKSQEEDNGAQRNRQETSLRFQKAEGEWRLSMD